MPVFIPIFGLSVMDIILQRRKRIKISYEYKREITVPNDNRDDNNDQDSYLPFTVFSGPTVLFSHKF